MTDKMPARWTDAQVEAACQTLERAVNAAYNSNHTGEQFVMAAAAAPALLEALEAADKLLWQETDCSAGHPVIRQIAAALAAAKGEA